jgi:hypothetical protein
MKPACLEIVVKVKFSTALIFGFALLGSACSSDVTSESLAIADFDANDFNSGNTFEDLVNPVWRLDGETNAERVGDGTVSAWLNQVDAYAEAREYQNYLWAQTSMNPARIAEQREELSALLSRPLPSDSGYSLDIAKKLYRHLVDQDQVRMHSNYSPNRQGVNLGFCFGRAMIVHSIAKNAFLSNETGSVSLQSIPVRKIWVTGPMGLWKHHVATMVMAKEADVGFWVIDNYIGRVVSAADWIATLHGENPDADVLFHVSRANRFSEANSMRYYQVNLDDPWFEGFFQDYLKTNVPMIRDLGGIDLNKSHHELLAEHRQLLEDVANDEDDEGTIESSESENQDMFGGESPRIRRNPAAPGEGVL